jgi:hypothetical protein
MEEHALASNTNQLRLAVQLKNLIGRVASMAFNVATKAVGVNFRWWLQTA